MLRLARQYSFLYSKFSALVLLLLVLTSLSLANDEEVITEDVLIYSIRDQVYSLSDIKEFNKAFLDFTCIYPGTMTQKYFKLLSQNSKDITLTKSELIHKQALENYQAFLEEILKLIKVSFYVKNQAVVITQELDSSLYQAAKDQGCSLSFFKKKRSEGYLRDILSFEVFYRSKNSENDSSQNASDNTKPFESYESLVNSILNQLDHKSFEII